ncbi:bromodomain-containing protein 7-like isoform X2 [Watersipora subatra]|uniref:bromodomain-containing protein 7-like isoform X2 n=1 Tax=Watersipora subatra TaxID=2589382 RepID=UPI00355C4BCF
MVKRSSKRSRKEHADSSSTLKMVLKLSAQEHASSQPASPNASVVSSDDDASRPAAKKSRNATHSQHSPANPPTRKGELTASDFVPPERNLRDRHRPLSPKPHCSALQDTLLYLHRLIEKRDNQHFFAFPINDLIAPDYSRVIKHPMDFSTMKDKIDRKVYTNIMEYKADVKLICVNAMNYNHPDTIYYKAAQKLLEYAMRTLSKDRLLSLRKNQPIMSSLTDAELSLHIDVDASDYIAPARAQKKQRDNNSYLTFEPVPDHLPAKDIIAIAKERAAAAEEHLAKKQRHSKMGFLRMSEDGTTTFNILNPDNKGKISDTERVITLGEKVGKLKAGLPYMDSLMVEDDFTDAKPIHYLNYGSYATGAPTYDSSFSTLSKKESDLVLSFYGSQNGLDYIQSLRAFVADSSPALVKQIDDLANIWTGNKHTEAQKLLEQYREKTNKETDGNETSKDGPTSLSASTTDAVESASTTNQANEAIDFESLKTIADLGIDTSFLEHFKVNDQAQRNLDNAAEHLTELNKLQSDRLSLVPSNDKAQQITDEEEKTVDKVSNQLLSLTKLAAPGDVMDEGNLRKAIGVGLLPAPEKTDAQVVDDLVSGRDESATEDILHSDALCHTIPLDESPSAAAK